MMSSSKPLTSPSAVTAVVSVPEYMQGLGQRARAAARPMAEAATAHKNRALNAIAHALRTHAVEVLAANGEDVKAAQQANVAAPLLDRLTLNQTMLEAMAEGCEQVAALADPVGQISELAYRPSGIQVGKMRVPLGVVGIIYESRPNVTVDAAILALKSGNAVILRGGSESLRSNQAIAKCIHEGLVAAELPVDAVQIVATRDRAAVAALISMPEYVDVIVPRGGKSLIERIARDATVPTLKHLDGICHVYLDQAADVTKAMAIAVNAKTHRYGVCNAMETLLVHAAIAPTLLPLLADEYLARGVELRLCESSFSMLRSQARFATDTGLLKTAVDLDWSTEYLAPILAIKVVGSAEQAMQHIAQYGSHHTDCIVTEDHSLAMRFLKSVDSASVMINASTRFADGAEFGLGAEIGISTDKLHARGPVGLEGLTSQKYIVFGNGQIRE